MAGVNVRLFRHRAASDRAAAIQQGEGGGGAVRAIHSVDRPSICQALAKEIKSQNRHPELFVQINIGEEPQKAGIAPGEADAFIASCRDSYGLTISGLMCIPPVDEPPAAHFALTAKIAARNGLKNLSMGMSADFATAIMLGATHVRVGSAIFGHR